MILCVTLNPCVDKTLYLDRIRPDEIQTASKLAITVGGKANNVARVLAAYGRDTVAMNVFGGETGHLCERLLREEDRLRTETVWTAAHTREIFTIYETDFGRHTDIKEPSAEMLPGERAEFVERFRALLPKTEMVSFGGSAPSEATQDLPAELLEIANEMKVPFVLDTYGEALALGIRKRPFMVKPNRVEAEGLLNRDLNEFDDSVGALAELANKADIAVLSLGEQGFLAAHEAVTYFVRAPKVEAANSVGSGDALVAGILIGVSGGGDFQDTLRLAAAAAAASAASPLACRIAPKDVEPYIGKVNVDVL